MPEDAAPSGLRSFWSGSITFGLVNVPVALYPATRAGGVHLRMVDDDGTPLRREYVCSKDGKELDWDDIVRGYEVKKGKFVTVTDEELEAIEPRKSREIDLRLFADIGDIDPMLFETAYYLVPAGGTNKAYRLLARVMEESGRAGIATFVMRAKEHVVAIIAENGILRAETLRFADEVRKPSDVGLPKKGKTSAAAVRKFSAAIGKHSGRLNLRELLDKETEKIERLAAKKQRKGEDVVKTEAAAEPAEGGEVIDLLEVLQRSMRGGKSSRRRRTSRRRKRAAG